MSLPSPLVRFEAAFCTRPHTQPIVVVIRRPHLASLLNTKETCSMSLRRLGLQQPDEGAAKRTVNIKSVVISRRKSVLKFL